MMHPTAGTDSSGRAPVREGDIRIVGLNDPQLGAHPYRDSMQGDCIVFNAWASTGAKVNRLLLQEARKAMTGKDTAYFKRHYKNGTTRASRVTVNEFVGQHLEHNID